MLRFGLALSLALCGCAARTGSLEMSRELARIRAEARDENPFLGDRDVRDLLARPAAGDVVERFRDRLALGQALLRLGRESEAVAALEEARSLLPALVGRAPESWATFSEYFLAVAHLRRGETANCCRRRLPHACILPIAEEARHADPEGSRHAIAGFERVLARVSHESSYGLRARWLLNIAHMTLGSWPEGVREELRIPRSVFDATTGFPRFENVAAAAGLATFDLAGGVAIEDFDGDGTLEVLVSTMDPAGPLRLFRREGAGGFVDRGPEAGLAGLLGGLNLVTADYDNDGDTDVLVLRGAWYGREGRHPNSLLRNDGKGRFRDVTVRSGLMDRLPTQAAGWADYDNDGDLDLYVGNEHLPELPAPSRLYRNEGDGRFTEVAAQAGVTNLAFAKAVSWGDYDGDRFPDLYVSNLDGPNRLYRNLGDGTFRDVAPELGVAAPRGSFPAWFWDYDNDGVLDLYVASYRGERGALADVVASWLGLPHAAEPDRLYRGDGRGGFEDVSVSHGLTRHTLPMGASFGDLDGDGWLDFYLGTGYPDYEALVPNVMYRNVGGERFEDVTFAGGFGHLQKGHAVAFADLDQDGDEDVFERMGGAFPGDAFTDVLYENPGFGNGFIALRLEGTESNRSAIGARIRVFVEENGVVRAIPRTVGTGASFGADPLRETIGIGRADRILRVEVYWPTSDRTTVFSDLTPGRLYRIVEGRPQAEERILDRPEPGTRQNRR